MQELLTKYKLSEQDLTNPTYYDQKSGDIERVCHRRPINMEEVERLFRVISTNKVMLQHGLTPLCPTSAPPLDSSTTDEQYARAKKLIATTVHAPNTQLLNLSQDEESAMKEVGLSHEEYSSIRGDGGKICGLSLGIHLYHRLLKTCTSKKAQAIHKDSAASRFFMFKKIKQLAQTRVLQQRALGL